MTESEKPRAFMSMDDDKQREIASEGGKAWGIRALSDFRRLGIQPEQVWSILPEITEALRLVEQAKGDVTPEAARQVAPRLGSRIPADTRDAVTYLMVLLTVAQLIVALLQLRTPPQDIDVVVNIVRERLEQGATGREATTDVSRSEQGGSQRVEVTVRVPEDAREKEAEEGTTNSR